MQLSGDPVQKTPWHVGVQIYRDDFMWLDVIHNGTRIVLSFLHLQYVVARFSEHLRQGGGAD